jgi:hypothetical protein
MASEEDWWSVVQVSGGPCFGVLRPRLSFWRDLAETDTCEKWEPCSRLANSQESDRIRWLLIVLRRWLVAIPPLFGLHLAPFNIEIALPQVLCQLFSTLRSVG